MSSYKIKIGIQGGRGSFNDSAIRSYLKDKDSSSYEIIHLNTTTNVLKALNNQKIQLGQFAIYNSTGGLYEESLNEIGKHTFNIVGKYGIKISHSLMIHKSGNIENIDTIMTHPQVMKQCKFNLTKKYGHIKLLTGEGQLTDPAKIAEEIAVGKIPNNVAVVSNKLLAEVFDLKIIETELEDNKNNESTFLLVSALKKATKHYVI